MLPKDFISPGKKPKDVLIADSAIWWEAKPDKSRKYGKKEFKKREVLTPKEAGIFLEVSGSWLSYFVQGKKVFLNSRTHWTGESCNHKVARQDLAKYRDMLQGRKFAKKTRTKKSH